MHHHLLGSVIIPKIGNNNHHEHSQNSNEKEIQIKRQFPVQLISLPNSRIKWHIRRKRDTGKVLHKDKHKGHRRCKYTHCNFIAMFFMQQQQN